VGTGRGEMGRGYGDVRERGHEGYGRCVREFYIYNISINDILNLFFFS
jgi:hypothetical protein